MRFSNMTVRMYIYVYVAETRHARIVTWWLAKNHIQRSKEMQALHRCFKYTNIQICTYIYNVHLTQAIMNCENEIHKHTYNQKRKKKNCKRQRSKPKKVDITRKKQPRRHHPQISKNLTTYTTTKYAQCEEWRSWICKVRFYDRWGTNIRFRWKQSVPDKRIDKETKTSIESETQKRLNEQQINAISNLHPFTQHPSYRQAKHELQWENARNDLGHTFRV